MSTAQRRPGGSRPAALPRGDYRWPPGLEKSRRAPDEQGDIRGAGSRGSGAGSASEEYRFPAARRRRVR